VNKDFQKQCRALVLELKLGRAEDIESIQALSGGVSSDIAMLTIADRKVCIKAALPQLKVAAQWLAPVHRNATEYRWLTTVSNLLPDAVPKLYGHSVSLGAFAMEYLDPTIYKNWKVSLLAANIEPQAARDVAQALVGIHAYSSSPSFDAPAFQQKQDFHALRLEPYLEFTAQKHSSLRDKLYAISNDFHVAQIALVHGDVSPKNILIGPKGPVLLDAECAVMGDPAFDIAFCMNHFLLKAVHLPQHAASFTALVEDFWQVYKAGVCWESADALEARVARLLPALLLARVDGKSPVEYLGSEQQTLVRGFAVPFIQEPTQHLQTIVIGLRDLLK
jgi:5-methylthioribose kinase